MMYKMKRKKISFKNFEDALKTLEEALEHPPNSELERDGVIQRFEYSFEMAWKAVQKFLKEQGKPEVSGSPKPILRDALEEHLISNLDLWFDFLKARNNSTHTYNQMAAEDVYRFAIRFPEVARELLANLNKKSQNG